MTAATDFWAVMEPKLRELAAQHLTALEIAETIGGVTRNAVIGQLRRRGIPLTGKLAVNGSGRFVKRAAVKRTKRAVITLKTLLDLGPDECRWPIDQPDGSFLFCSDRSHWWPRLLCIAPPLLNKSRRLPLRPPGIHPADDGKLTTNPRRHHGTTEEDQDPRRRSRRQSRQEGRRRSPEEGAQLER